MKRWNRMMHEAVINDLFEKRLSQDEFEFIAA